MILLHELLHVLWSRPACSGLKKPATIHQRNNRKHLGTRAHFENWKQVSEVITQDVPSDRNCFLASFQSLKRNLGSFHRAENSKIQTFDVVIAEISANLLDELGIMRPVFIKPENCRRSRGARTIHRKLHPILNRSILGLASTPNVAFAHFVLHEGFASRIDHPNSSSGWNFESLIVRAIFFRLLRH